MKKTVIFLLLTLVLILSACTAVNLDEYTYTKELNGVTYTVDPKALTITAGEHVYQYTKTETAVTVIYPNGAKYTEPLGDRYATSNWQGSKPTGAPEGWELVNLLLPTRSAPKEVNTEFLIFGLVMLILGLFNAILPKIGWFLRYGWTFKNPEYAEPSEAFVTFGRIVGVIMAIVGAVTLVMAFF